MSFENNDNVDILNDLWKSYEFPGRSPRFNSSIYIRLLDKCKKYALYMDGQRSTLSPDENGNVRISNFEQERRLLHNEICIMTIGRQRSGLDSKIAESVAEFAYEFARGVKFEDRDKYKN